MKILFRSALLLLFVQLQVFGQKTTITGKVLAKDNTPLEGAAVYLNNTSVGTTTNEEGEFELSLKEGNYDLIASYLGFETAQFTLDTKEVNRSIVFKLTPKANMLNEVVVSGRNNVMSAEDRAYFLGQFKKTFLGKTNLAQECKITNEDVIDLDFNPLSRVLEAYISKPIIIEHKGLGYRIYYDLVHFELGPEKVTYLGYTRYENLRGSKRKLRKWNKKRQVAYNGSSMHFLRSIQNENVKKEGFIVDKYRRIPNPDRPSDSVIQSAREKLRTLNKSEGVVNFILSSNRNLNDKSVRDDVLKRAAKNKNIPTNVNIEKMASQDFEITQTEKGLYEAKAKQSINRERDSLLNIVKKARLKRFVNELVKEDVKLAEFSKKKASAYYLSFPEYLKVKYMNEPEEYNFRRGDVRLEHQESLITLYVNPSQIHATGTLFNPLDLFMEGYWSYERIADTLPLDYEPTD